MNTFKEKTLANTQVGTVGILCLGLALIISVVYSCKKPHDALIDETSSGSTQTTIITTDSSSTDSSSITDSSCEFENPLTDLPWLKEFINIHERNAQAGDRYHARIYQCNYRDGIGFLLEMCVDCPDFGYSFLNCEGRDLCSGGGFTGRDNCPDFNIDFKNKKLIWEINNNSKNNSCEFDNPLTDLYWLKKIVEEFIAYSDNVSNRHFQIYQCTYIEDNDEKIGFIVTPICVDCRYGSAMLYKCSGVKLCNNMSDNCNELYNVNKKLIWEINN